jgi:ferredoxin
MHNRCIGCGSCVTVCSPEAIVYQDSRDATKSLLASGQKVAAVLALSISGEFSDIVDYRRFVEMIRRLGFAYVVEASFAIDLVSQKYAELFQHNKGKYYFTSTCPPVFYYIEKFHPELVENLAPIVSPMIAAAKVVHQKYGTDTKIVYIGPCIATKMEAIRYEGSDGQVDSVLTFRELRELLSEFNIKENMSEFSDYDPPFGNKGSLYPVSNGLLQSASINEDLMYGNVITVEGRDNMLRAVKEFEQLPVNIKRHFNLFYDEGCIMGPGTTKGGKRYLRQTLIVSYTRKRLRNLNKKEWAKNLKFYSSLNLSTSFKADDQRLPMPSEEEIMSILKNMGKENPGETQDCGSCGFDSCREFASIVAMGLTKQDMCITYSFQNRQEYVKNLRFTNEKLIITQKALQESEKVAREEQQLAHEAMQTMENVLQKLPTSIVIVDENLHIMRANESLIKILGPEVLEISDIIPGLVGADIKTLVPYNVYNLFSYAISNGEDIQNRDIHINNELFNISVFSVKKNKIVGAVIRDMYAPEIRKEEVIKRITEVIDKNLEMVQKIGFLLGEGAAETEQMLNSIMEFYKTAKL